MRVFVTIKPTKHNKKVLKERGLFSDDSRYYFAMYEKVLSDEEYRFETKTRSDDFICDEFIEAGLKF